MTTQQVGIPITKQELEKIEVLEQEFSDYCVDSRLLLDPKRYSSDPLKARKQFLKRLNMFDCYKGIIGVQGEPRVGKSGWIAAYAWQAKEWFDIPIITMGFRYTTAFGEHTYINHEDFLEELGKTSELAAKEGDAALDWNDSNIKSIFRGALIIIEEAHKFLDKTHRTRASMYIKDLLAEWGHYSIGVVLITHDLTLLDPKRVGKFITHQATVSRNYYFSQTSDIRLFNMATAEWKDTIEFYRPPWYKLWATKAPIMARSNVSAKDVRRILTPS